MAPPDAAPPPAGASAQAPRAGVAFLLTQIGGYAASHFAERVAELDLTPPLTGLLRLIAMTPGRSQQSLATELDMLPSKVVSLIDQLEALGLVQRSRDPRDRRVHALSLTPAANQTLDQLRQVATAHEREMLAPLDDAEKDQLAGLLQRIADHHHLHPGIHPGYRNL